MRTISSTFVAVGLLLLPFYAGAQQQQQQRTPAERPATRAPEAREAKPQQLTQDMRVTVNQLRNAQVVDKQGQELGQVRELRIDPKEGRITEAEIGVGGILGIGEERFSVKFDQAEVMQHNGQIVLALSEEAAKMAREDVERQRGEPRRAPTKGSGGY